MKRYSDDGVDDLYNKYLQEMNLQEKMNLPEKINENP